MNAKNLNQKRRYYFLLKNVGCYYKFLAKDNNEAIKHLKDLGVSYSDGYLDYGVMSMANTKFILVAREINSSEVLEFAKKNSA